MSYGSSNKGVTARFESDVAYVTPDDGETKLISGSVLASVRDLIDRAEGDEAAFPASVPASLAEASRARPNDTPYRSPDPTHGDERVAPRVLSDAPSDSLASLLDRRQSSRDFSSMSIEQLGTLLFRVGRTREWLDGDDGEDGNERGESRPLPSAGAAHPISFEILALDVNGLADGVWHFAPTTCELVRIESHPPIQDVVDQLGNHGFSTPPAAVIFTVAQFSRTLVRYPGGSTLVWRDAGVAQLGVHLVACDLGLSSCIIGSAGILYPSLDPSAPVDVGAVAVG